MQTIPLNRLVISEENVRKAGHEEGLDALETSILTYGLQQNLVVVSVNDSNKFEIIAGGRRYKAMKKLQKKGKLAKDYPVPCNLANVEDATVISLSENIVRSDMHPADQYKAFAKLVSEGKTVGDIAALFVVSEDLVKKRLKLGRVSPELMSAYREEKLSIDVLMAFTLSDDHKKQDEVYNLFKDSIRINPYDVRKALTVSALQSDHKLVKYIGIDAYKDAGGTCKEDLFSREGEGCYLEDMKLVYMLVEDKLRLEGENLGVWKWIEARPDFPHDELAEFDRIYPHTLGNIPDELNQRYQALEAMIEEIDANGEDSEENEAIQQQIQELNQEMAVYHGFSEEDRNIAGCILTVDYYGRLIIHEGLVKSEDKKDFNKVSIEGNDALNKLVQPYSKSLTDSLKFYRLHVMKLHMANNFETAFDVAVYVLCIATFKAGRHRKDWLTVRGTKFCLPFTFQAEDETAILQQQEEADFITSLPLEWLNNEDETERFTSFCNLDEQEKKQLFSFCVAQSLQPQLTTESHASPLFEIVCKRLGVELQKYWRPTERNFFSRISKPKLLNLGEEIFGRKWVDSYSDLKKTGIVKRLHDAFVNPKQAKFSYEQQKQLENWLPEGMAPVKDQE